MKFDYEYYRRVLFWVPLGALIFFTFCILGTIVIAFIIKKPFNADWMSSSLKETLYNFCGKKIVKLIFVFLMSLFFLTNMYAPIGRLKYGIFLRDETPKDALITKGKIEDIKIIKNPSTHTYKSIKGENFEKYTPLECDAHLITISEKEYYFMIKGDLQVGDYVEIKYLPKSTIVLEVKIIETE